MKTASYIEVVLSHDGKFGLKKVQSKWPELNIPARHLSSYIKDAKDVDTDEYLTFRPSGKKAIKNGKEYDIWTCGG